MRAQTLRWGITGAGTAAALSLVAHLPASLAADYAGVSTDRMQPYGTLWQGSIRHHEWGELSWHTDPAASLFALALTGDVQAAADGLKLEGIVVLRPGEIALSQVEAEAEFGALRRLEAKLHLDCNTVWRMAEGRAEWRSDRLTLDGTAAALASACRTPEGTAFTIPAMQLTARAAGIGSQVKVVSADGDARLAEAVIGPDGALTVTLSEAAQALVPGAQPAGPIVFEMRAACSGLNQPNC
jgi:hypothetical protein